MCLFLHVMFQGLRAGGQFAGMHHLDSYLLVCTGKAATCISIGKSTPDAVLSNLDLELVVLPAWMRRRAMHETHRGCGWIDWSIAHRDEVGGGGSWARAVEPRCLQRRRRQEESRRGAHGLTRN
jgi:hypothetical protein